jgi:hypothetical protein
MSFTKKDRKIRSTFGKTFPNGPDEATGGRRFADVIAGALHREFEGAHAAVKTISRLTGANERAVKNWFDGKNGPSGEHLVILARHCDHVLEAFLVMAARSELVKAKRLGDARQKLTEILAIIDEIQAGG